MNIIFLDIDGVMNMYGNSSRTFMKPYGQHIEPHLVNRLNYICKNVPDLSIVISSSWRSNMEDLEKQLVEQGFKYWNKVIGKTPHPYSSTQREDKTFNIGLQYRGEQIQDWLLDNTDYNINNFLVIDDEVSDICGDKCNLISSTQVYQIDGKEGLLDRDAMNIIKFFKDINGTTV